MNSTLRARRLSWLTLWLLLAGVYAALLTIVLGRFLPWLDAALRESGWRLLYMLPAKAITPFSIVAGVYLGLVGASLLASRARRETTRRRRPPLLLIYSLLALPVLFIGMFNYVPAVSALYHAFTRWDVGAESTWVGLANFRELLTDPVFRQSCWNLFRLGVFAFVAQMTVPFVVSEMIYHLRSERASYYCRVAVVLPMIVPGVVIFMLWGNIYSDGGLLTEFLRAVGLREYVRAWLSDPKTALWAIACVGFPFAVGINVLIYYAGLANISQDILEASEIDGLGKVGQVFRIHIPLVLSQVRLLMVLTIIGVVNGFESILILTADGGPGYETMVPGLYMYLNGFTYQRMGYACAIGLLMLLFLLGFTVTANRLLRSEDS